MLSAKKEGMMRTEKKLRCWRKLDYGTRDEALASAVRKQRRDRKHRRRYVYYHACGNWHVTSLPQGLTTSLKVVQ